jgi:hypothetical protein
MLSRCARAWCSLAMIFVLGLGISFSSQAQELTVKTASHSATLTWTTSATTGVTYNVYRGTSAAGPFSATTGIKTTSYTDGAVTAGTTYVYYVTAFCGPTGCPVGIAGESLPSAQVTATIPNPPAPPTGLSVTIVVVN